ncbi:MAG: STAS domain-containing protein [Anaerolineae bacterium]
MNIAMQEETKKIITICPEGRLDSFAAPQLRAKLVALVEGGYHNVLLDLRQIEFIDSACIAVLISTLKLTQRLGGDTKLVIPNDAAIREMIQLSNFDKIFTIVETPELAFELF